MVVNYKEVKLLIIFFLEITMEIKDFIRVYCNPVTCDDLIKTINLFDDLDYDEYIEDIINIVEVEINNNINNVPLIIHNILVKHLYNIISTIGITLNKEMIDIKIPELNSLLEFMVDLKFSSIEDSCFILDTLEMNDDVLYGFSIIVNRYTGINILRLYDYIDKIDNTYIVDLETTLSYIKNNDTENISNYDLVSVIKELRINNEQEVTGLRIMRDSFEDEYKLIHYLTNYLKDLYNKDISIFTTNILSIIILSSDYRFNIIEGYVNIIEDTISDETIKSIIFKQIKELEPKIKDLYLKYNIKEVYDE